ncbi:MAG: alkylation response protein AidB-like acyl-CoA dehydrogenase [Myxococcota bacterium]|jgi:alkylation response protein AidB-like acyl-CoA dehydrogenase
MRIAYTEEQIKLRDELRAYFRNLITPEIRQQLGAMEGGPLYKKLIKQMGNDGWLGVGWPKEFGGLGRTWIEQQIWFDEARKANAPVPFVTINTVGPALMQLGTDEQKKRFLPGILTGDLHFAIGYTEPDAGTDLATLTTTAVRDGDDYIINGTKIFTSGADDADYVWLACRTDPDVPKHKGISILIVDTKLEGFTSSPIHIINGGYTFMTYYENVRVPAKMVVGKVNLGWKLITLQLNHERVGLAAFSNFAIRLFDETVDWAKSTMDEDGRRVADKPWVQMALAESFALLEAMKVTNWKMAWGLEAGEPDPAQSSAAKVLATEFVIEVYRLLLEVLGTAGMLKEGSPGAALQGHLEHEVRLATVNTFGGGVNEVQRELVAMLGLGMPRAAR